MSSEWSKFSLASVVDVTDYVANGSFASLKENVKYLGGNGYAVMARLVDHNANWQGERVFVSEHAYKFLRKSSLVAGDIVIANVGANAGTVFRVPRLDRPMTLGPNAVRVRPRSDCTNVLEQEYLYYYLSSPVGQEQIQSIITGSAQPKFNKTALRSLELTLPKVIVQRRVGSLMSALDERITLLRETNATLETLAQTLFKSWFVDFDPVRAKMEGRVPEGMDEATAALFPECFEESEFGVVPRGWHWDRLDSLASIVMGLSPKGDSYNSTGTGIPLINGPVEFGEYFPVRTKWTEETTRLATEGDLILCVRGSTTGRRVVSDGEYCIGRGVCAIRAKDGFAAFLYQTIDFGLTRLLSKTTGSVFPSLSGPDIKSFDVLQPSLGEKSAFENAVKPVLFRIQQNHRIAATLTNVRDTLLPRLISGQLRLPQAEALIEEVSA